jgi:glycosyltransferase involved in cell wall biosynthesis
MKNKNLIIYALNISGIGSKIWFFQKIKELNSIKSNITVYTNSNFKRKIKGCNHIRLIDLGKFNFIYMLFAKFIIRKDFNEIYSMGDYPLPFIKDQTIYLNQANLINPSIYKYSSRKLIFKLKRFYFRVFSQNIKTLIVQSIFMKKYIGRSFKNLRNRLIIDNNLYLKTQNKHNKKLNKKFIKILYPASIYPHKNHILIINFLKKYLRTNYHFYFTCGKYEFNKYEYNKHIHRINYYNHGQIYKTFNKFDCIIFPSLIESLGLPLIESKIFNIPIIASNLPFAREILGNQGIYFSPNSERSLYKSLNKVFNL